MITTMYHHNGVGLAAPQIGLSKRLFIAAEVDKTQDDTEDEDAPPPVTIQEKRERWHIIRDHVMVNPEILSYEGQQAGVDGCLSLPGLFTEAVERPDRVRVRYQDVAGEQHELVAEGHFAWVIQHEYDHLEGVFFLERLPSAERKAFMNEHRSELAQMQRDAKAFLKEHKNAPISLV